MSADKNIMKTDEKKSCCGCNCDEGKLAALLRHIAEFFDKKK